MFTLNIPEISATAGQNSDGIVRGYVAQSAFVGVHNNFELSDELYAIVRDTSTGVLVFTDQSTQAKSGVPDAFLPFGDTASFSSNDSFYLAGNSTVSEIRVTITTSGVWTGAGLAIYDSTDGITANRLLGTVANGNLVDGSDGFRNGPGTYSLTWTTPLTPGVAFSPIPGDIASRPWVMICPTGFSAKTTAPGLSLAFVLHPSTSEPYTDQTAQYNYDPVTYGTFGVMPSALYFIDANNIFSFPALPIGMDLAIHRKIVTGVRTGVLEYLASDNTWKTLTGAYDPSNWFENGPTTLGDPIQNFKIRWPIPADWTSKTLVLPLEIGGTDTVVGWHMRFRANTVTTIGPVAPPLVRGRGLALGAGYAGGLYHYAGQGRTYQGVTFEVGIPALTDVVMQVTNIDQGTNAQFTVPAATYSSSALVPDRLDLSAPLAVADGESILISWVSGGTLQDAELILQ